MIKNILQKILEFIKNTHEMMYDERYIIMYDNHMRMRSRM